MPKPGRNALGQWAADDATGQQTIEAIVSAVECLGAALWMHAEQRAEFDGHIATAKAAVGLADAGERPVTEVKS